MNRIIRNNLFKLLFFAALLIQFPVLYACEGRNIIADDLVLARQAYLERNLPLCERLLERYLREEQDPEKRWEAWELLLKAINSNNQQARASLECLDAMLEEYVNDEKKLAIILEDMGKYNITLRHYSQAADAFASLIELGQISDEQRVEAYRNLAAMQFSQRHFEAGEETLQQCLGLPIPDHDKIYCMLDLADENMTLERFQEVADLCQQILDSEPDKNVFGIACYLSGDALEQLGKKKEALQKFEMALDSYPNPAVIENRIKYLKNPAKDSK